MITIIDNKMYLVYNRNRKRRLYEKSRTQHYARNGRDIKDNGRTDQTGKASERLVCRTCFRKSRYQPGPLKVESVIRLWRCGDLCCCIACPWSMDSDLLLVAKDDLFGRQLQDMNLLTRKRASRRRTRPADGKWRKRIMAADIRKIYVYDGFSSSEPSLE